MSVPTPAEEGNVSVAFARPGRGPRTASIATNKSTVTGQTSVIYHRPGIASAAVSTTGRPPSINNIAVRVG